MIDHTLRASKALVLIPVASRLAWIHPTAITLLAFGMGLLTVASIVLNQYHLTWIFWLLNRVLDGLDGEVARRFGKQTDFGGYIDILCDMAIYALIPIALVFANPSDLAWLWVAFLLATFYINAASWMFLSAVLEKRTSQQKGTSIVMPTGIIEGTETIIFYFAFLLFPSAFVGLSIAMSVLVISTIVQRIIWAWHTILKTSV
jgi:phosphatidylglycerophosphate synthase